MSTNGSEVIRLTDCSSHDSFLQTCWEDPTLKFFFLYYRVFDDMKLWKVKSCQCVSYRQDGKQEVAVLWVFSSGSDARRHLRRYDRRVHLAGCTVRYQGNACRWETTRWNLRRSSCRVLGALSTLSRQRVWRTFVCLQSSVLSFQDKMIQFCVMVDTNNNSSWFHRGDIESRSKVTANMKISKNCVTHNLLRIVFNLHHNGLGDTSAHAGQTFDLHC